MAKMCHKGFAAYGAMCIFLCTSYTRLIKKLTDKRKEG